MYIIDDGDDDDGDDDDNGDGDGDDCDADADDDDGDDGGDGDDGDGDDDDDGDDGDDDDGDDDDGCLYLWWTKIAWCCATNISVIKNIQGPKFETGDSEDWKWMELAHTSAMMGTSKSIDLQLIRAHCILIAQWQLPSPVDV